MRKLGLVLLVLLLLGTVCLEAAPKTKIIVGCYPALDEAYAAIMPAFNKKYPNIEVEIKSLGFDDHHSTLVTALAAGEGAPDVAALEIAYVAQFVGEGGLVNLLQAPYNAGRYKGGITPYTWAQGSSDDGRLIAMPADIAPGWLFTGGMSLRPTGLRLKILRPWKICIRQVLRSPKIWTATGKTTPGLSPTRAILLG